MKLVFVNIMHDLHALYSTATISQPPVALAVLNAVTPAGIETALVDEQVEPVEFVGDVFAFSMTTQFAGKVYGYADDLRAAGKKVILGGIHVTVCPDEAAQHADAIVTGEAETIWPTVCNDLLAERLRARYSGTPTPPSEMRPVDYRFFEKRPYRMPASLFATRGCDHACTFCVSSRYMGPFRTKPLDVLEQEMDQAAELFPGSTVQFTDDNLLADRSYGLEVLAMLRRKQRQFVTMVTVDQLCDTSLVEEMAASGCLAVAVGVESVDDDNCTSMKKYHNVKQPLTDAILHANKEGIHVCPLIIVGLPHDSPQRLANTQRYLASIPCTAYDLASLRVYPSTSLYADMLKEGRVTKDWWMGKEPVATNHFLPGYLRVHFEHANFTPMQLQYWALKLTYELNRLSGADVMRILSIGRRGGSLPFAALGLAGRRWIAKQARKWLDQVEQAIESYPAEMMRSRATGG